MVEAFSKALEETSKEAIKSSSDLPAFSKEVKPENINTFAEANKPLSEVRADNIAENREKGAGREEQVKEELKENYPESEGHQIHREVDLLNDQGGIAKDPVTGKGRRIDFVVTNGEEVLKSIEVTSETASKVAQLEKEGRIREDGGNYIKDRQTGELKHMPASIDTEVWRRT